jgi:hypothetical protein
MVPAWQAAERAVHVGLVRGRDLAGEGGTGRDVRDEAAADLVCAHG